MPIISFANPKGGAGKTTAALILASELATKGATVTVIDADPEEWISQWADKPGRPETLDVVNKVTEETIIDQIDEAAGRSQFVIIDLEGTANVTVGQAISLSDFVIIPIQGAKMDAKGGAKTIKLIRRQERISRRQIPYAVLLTRTGAAITTRALRDVQNELLKANIDILKTELNERAAFKELVDFGGVISDLDPRQVANLDKAVANARNYVGEVLTKIKTRGNDEKARVA